MERRFGTALVGALACMGMLTSAAHAGTAALDGYTGAKVQIMSYYAANAREGAGICGPGHIADIGDARVVREGGDAVVLSVDYAYSARSNAGTNECSGTGTPEFTLAKDGAGYTVTGMTGHAP